MLSLMQALASCEELIGFLRRAVSAAGPSAPDLAVALLECLVGLAPRQHAIFCPSVSPGPVLSALR